MTPHSAAVVVVGSLNTDHLIRVAHLPGEGETVVGSDYLVAAGGKGLNQALAAARQGASVAFVGCVGADEPGRALLSLLVSEGVDVSHVRVVDGEATGVALVTVAEGGANTIVVAPQANSRVTVADIARAGSLIDGARVLLTQLEIPTDAVEAALVRGRGAGVVTMLNPAPALAAALAAAPASAPVVAAPASAPVVAAPVVAAPVVAAPVAVALSPGLAGSVDVLVPNGAEATALTGLPASEACMALQHLGPSKVVVTMGSAGALFGSENGVAVVDPFSVRTVDTTGAGDAFCGALAAGIAAGLPFSVALRRASAAGALATTIPGAVPSLPTAQAVDALVSSSGGGC